MDSVPSTPKKGRWPTLSRFTCFPLLPDPGVHATAFPWFTCSLIITQVVAFIAVQMVAVPIACNHFNPDEVDPSKPCGSDYRECHARVNIDAQAGFGPKLKQGEFWRLWTVGIHSNDVWALIGASVFEVLLSWNFEYSVGSIAVAFLWSGSRVLASLFRYSVSPQEDFYKAQLGFSGGAYGVVSAELCFLAFYWEQFMGDRRRWIFVGVGSFIVVFEVIDLLFKVVQKLMDALNGSQGSFKNSNESHVGGLLAGMLLFLAFLWQRKLDTSLSGFRKRVRRSWLVRLLCAIGAIAIASVGAVVIHGMDSYEAFTQGNDMFCRKS